MVAGLLAGLLAAVAAAELLIRLYVYANRKINGRKFRFLKVPAHWNPPQAVHHRLLYESHPYIIWVLRKNVRTMWPANGKMHPIGTNNHGFIGTRDVSVEKPEGTIRIFCIGGSIVEETTGDDYNNSFPHWLERKLRESFSEKVEVINAGVASYSSAESLVNFEMRLLEFKPDMIVVYHAPNDAVVGMFEGFKADYSHIRVNRGVEPNFWNMTRECPHSFLYSLIRGTLVKKFGKSHWLVGNINKLETPLAKEFNPDTVRVYKRNMKNICNLAVRNSVLPVVVKVIYNPRADTGEATDIKTLLGKDDRVFMQTLRANIAAIKEIAQEVPGTEYIETGGLPEEAFRDSWHFSTEGKKVFGHLLGEKLIPLMEKRFKR